MKFSKFLAKNLFLKFLLKIILFIYWYAKEDLGTRNIAYVCKVIFFSYKN